MTRTVTVLVHPGDAGRDLRFFVRRRLNLSARILTALKYTGKMLRNGQPVRSVDVLQAGDVLTFTLFDTSNDYAPTQTPLSVLFENEDFLVLDKPADMPVHPSPGHDCDSVLNAAAWYFRNTEDFVFRPLYRLDRDTTGALVLAKNKFAASAVLEKTYTAVCEGVVPEHGVVDAPIGLKPGHTIERCTGFGVPAVTRYERISEDGTHSLVRFQLETGRTHQIRVHMASIGHPVAGDDLYGGYRDLIDRQMLRCTSVHIECPVLEMNQTIRAPFSDTQQRCFPRLFQNDPK